MKALVACEFSGAVPVPGYPMYRVTRCGKLFSLHGRSPRQMRARLDAKGYACVHLRGAAKRRNARMHQLVAEAFIPNPRGLPCVRHLDGNPANNCADNLAWGSYAENERDKIGHGTWNSRFNGKLTSSARDDAFALSAEGWSQKAIAELIGVSRPTITRLLNGSTWGAML